jgi:inosose dehydratase
MEITRREFLQSSAAIVGGIPFVRTLAPSIRFGYAAITWNGKDVQAMEDIAALGFRGIQLRSGILPTYERQPEVLRGLLAKHRLTFVALSSGNVSVDPSRRSATIEEHVSHARFVRDAGGMYLQLIDEKPKDRSVTADDVARLGDIMSEIGRRAADLGVAAGYHPHMGTIGETPDAMERVLAASDAKYVKLLLDVAHYTQGGGDPAAAIRRHRDRLLFLHVKDVQPRGVSYRFVELGRGRVDLKGVFNALSEESFDGWVVVELDAVPDGAGTPKEAGMVNKRFLESLGFDVSAKGWRWV